MQAQGNWGWSRQGSPLPPVRYVATICYGKQQLLQPTEPPAADALQVAPDERAAAPRVDDAIEKSAQPRGTD